MAACALLDPGAAGAQTAVTTPSTVKIRAGDLQFVRGFPTEETKQKVFDEIDYQRAVQAYLWAYPVVSFQSIMMASKAVYGTDLNAFAIADNYVDYGSQFLTANDTTIYAYANVDLGKSGPTVVEIPPGLIVGIIDDFWQKSLVDVGLPGPDGDKGGKFLLLPPGYEGDVPTSGYHVLKGTMNNYNVMVRGILADANGQAAAVANVKRVKIYPLSESSSPKPNKFVTMSGVPTNTLPPQGLEFWARLSQFIDNNPVQERDRFYMAMLKPLGIEKGKPFSPGCAPAAPSSKRPPGRGTPWAG